MELVVNRGGIYGTPAEELAEKPLPMNAWRVRPSDDHMGNFFDCIKSREKPISDVEIGHRSTTVCHLGNIARWTGRPLKWDAAKEVVIDDQAANELLQRNDYRKWS